MCKVLSCFSISAGSAMPMAAATRPLSFWSGSFVVLVYLGSFVCVVGGAPSVLTWEGDGPPGAGFSTGPQDGGFGLRPHRGYFCVARGASPLMNPHVRGWKPTETTAAALLTS